MAEVARIKENTEIHNDADELLDVAVDNGYADQKIAYWTKNEKGEKTIAELLLPSRAEMGATNVSIDGKSNGVYAIDGDFWTVGKNVTSPETIRGDKYAFSELNTVLVNHSLIAAGFGGKSVRIATGLPFDQYYKNGEPHQEVIDRVKAGLTSEVTPKGDFKTAIIKSHEVFPESTAAFVDYAVDEKTGEMKIELDLGLCLVDIGGNTTDISCIDADNMTDMNRSGTKKIGVLDVRNRLRPLIQQKFEINGLKDSQLDNALRSGKCKIFGKEEDVSEEIGLAKRETLKKLMLFIEEVVGDAADLDFILFVGGGAAALSDVIKEYPHARVPDRPQFANARGMLKYLTYVR